MKIYNRIYNTLGICRKAGKLVLGTAAVEKSILTQKAKLVVLSSSVSQRTLKKYQTLCDDKNIDILIIDDNNCLGKSIGRDGIKIMAITDHNFKKMVYESYNDKSGGEL